MNKRAQIKTYKNFVKGCWLLTAIGLPVAVISEIALLVIYTGLPGDWYVAMMYSGFGLFMLSCGIGAWAERQIHRLEANR
jgi:hypothetical protein